MSNYIDDAGGGERQSDSFLGNPDTIFHGENDEFTRQLDARMIARLTPEERLKMGAEPPEKLQARVEAAAGKATDELYAKRKASTPAESEHRPMKPIIVIILILCFLALVALMARAHGAENSFGNSAENPVKTAIPAPGPAPTIP
jgi:hypothetical protein